MTRDEVEYHSPFDFDPEPLDAEGNLNLNTIGYVFGLGDVLVLHKDNEGYGRHVADASPW